MYFRLLMIGYFEGIDSERGIAWRAADSLGIRAFLGVGLDETVADQTTISRTRRLLDVETHEVVFGWVLSVLAEHGLLRGKTIGIDATTLEADAALRSIVRKDTGESYEQFLRKLAQESGIETPTQAQAARLPGFHQPEISLLRRGRLGAFGIERLVRCLGALDMGVELRVFPKKPVRPDARRRELGRAAKRRRRDHREIPQPAEEPVIA